MSSPPQGRMREVLEPTAGPALRFDLAEQIEQLRAEKPWQAGRNSKTLIKFADFRIVLTVMKGGTRIPGHHADGRISIQTVSGHVRVHSSEGVSDLPAGHVLVLDRTIPHDVEALEDSAFLLTLAWSGTAHAPLPHTEGI